MQFFTGKGDGGTTTDFAAAKRESKASQLFEALGALDETVSAIGICRAKVRQGSTLTERLNLDAELLLSLQQNLFTIQAELAGSDKKLGDEKVRELEAQIAELGRTLPEIRSFLIPGESELGALFDLARTVARRAERELVRLKEQGSDRAGASALAYMNRLSSILYVLARREASKSGINEGSPTYR